MADSLAHLLDLLGSGDAAAAAEIFRRFEPYLRKVVRRNLRAELRARFDSEDVVQSVWVSLLQGFRGAGWRFADIDHLRAFLVRATRNRFLDRVRQHGRSVERETHFGPAEPAGLPPARGPRPSQLVQCEELWRRILALCPPEHRELVRSSATVCRWTKSRGGRASIATASGACCGSWRGTSRLPGPPPYREQPRHVSPDRIP